MRQRRFQQVDVFSAQPLLGNPLAVVLDGQDLDDAQMQAFAAWTQLSETTFVLPPTAEGRAQGADYRVRIFTPGGELPFAGHPTLGTAQAWLAAGGQPQASDRLVQECGVGLVTLRQQNGRLAFAAPSLRRSPIEATQLPPVLDALGLAPEDVLAAQWLDNGPRWLGLWLCDVETVLGLEPDHARLQQLGTKVGVAARRAQAPGLIRRASREARAFAAHADDTDIEVRAFAAPVGIAEDPVTGSLNASLAQWLIADGHLPTRYRARQGTRLGRAGEVFVSQDPTGQVWIGGDVAPCIRGSVAL
ncbi:MAG: PhzF family phenazine biosynthesis protein [Betaproteobacteria bacterium]|nr:PhzF family phenazine biosynthesis protein [Betaproteobacteria bacterium]